MSIFHRTVIAHTGKQGPPGQDGENGVGVDQFSLSTVNNPMLQAFFNSALLKKGYDALTFLRPTTNENPSEGFIEDNDGSLKWNYQNNNRNYVEDPLNGAAWGYNGTYLTRNTTSATDPDGGNNATRYTANLDTTSQNGLITIITDSFGDIRANENPDSSSFWVSFYARSHTGTVSSIDVQLGSDFFVVGTDIPSTWTRYSVFVNEAIGSIITINPRMLATEAVEIAFPQYERSFELTDFHDTDVERDFKQILFNQKGYRFNGEMTNEAQYSLDLTKWTVGQATVSDTPDSIFGGGGFRCNLAAFGSTDITLDGLLNSVTPSEDYTVSFYAKVYSGAALGFSASVGGGGAGVITDSPEAAAWKRFSIPVTSGILQTVNITVLAPTGGLTLGLMGIQAERGSISDLVPSSDFSGARAYSTAKMPYRYNIPPQNAPFTIAWRQSEIESDDQYVFYASSDLYCRYLSGAIEFVSGSNILTAPDAAQAERVIIIYDGVDFILYLDGVKITEQAATTLKDNVERLVYWGGTNSESTLTGYLYDFQTYKLAIDPGTARSL